MHWPQNTLLKVGYLAGSSLGNAVGLLGVGNRPHDGDTAIARTGSCCTCYDWHPGTHRSPAFAACLHSKPLPSSDATPPGPARVGSFQQSLIIPHEARISTLGEKTYTFDVDMCGYTGCYINEFEIQSVLPSPPFLILLSSRLRVPATQRNAGADELRSQNSPLC